MEGLQEDTKYDRRASVVENKPISHSLIVRLVKESLLREKSSMALHERILGLINKGDTL
jgi:hypothetical protein